MKTCQHTPKSPWPLGWGVQPPSAHAPRKTQSLCEQKMGYLMKLFAESTILSATWVDLRACPFDTWVPLLNHSGLRNFTEEEEWAKALGGFLDDCRCQSSCQRPCSWTPSHPTTRWGSGPFSDAQLSHQGNPGMGGRDKAQSSWGQT